VKFRVERDVLADAVAWVARTLPTRPPVPVLAGLLVEAAADGLALASFDYEVSSRATVDADVAEPGRVLVSGRLLSEIARSLPSRPVEVTLEDGDRKLVIACGSSRFVLLTLPLEDYPALPEMPELAGQLGGASFAQAVSQVAVAAGRDDTLPVLTGIRMEFDGERVTLAATDRYRLAVRELVWSPERASAEAIALVRARTLADAARALADAPQVVVALSGNGSGEGLIGFEGSIDGHARRTTTRLVDGEFPKYRALLPAESTSVAAIETASFIDSVKRVALVAERNTPVRLSFSDGEVRLEAGTGDEAQAVEVVEATLSGDPLTIAFNPQYLLDGLAAIGTPIAELSFTTATKPAVLSGRAEAEGAADVAYRYLLMPVRLSG
jgi:DNA polymerase-3 subunit beta